MISISSLRIFLMKIKQQNFSVKSISDTKQRRLPEQLMIMAATANYAKTIVNRGKFKKHLPQVHFWMGK